MGFQSDARTRAHSQSFRKTEQPRPSSFARSAFASAMRPRIALTFRGVLRTNDLINNLRQGDRGGLAH